MPLPTPRLDAHTHRYQPGIPSILNAVVPEDWSGLIQLSLKTPLEPGGVALGLHPWYASRWKPHFKDELRNAILQIPPSRRAGIGEVGLDFLKGAPDHPLPSLEEQMRALSEQWDLAEELHLPLFLHLRKAWDPFFQFVAQRGGKHCIPHGSPVHGFTGSAEIARQLLSMGIALSFSRQRLLQNQRLKTLFDTIPEERRFTETDQSRD